MLPIDTVLVSALGPDRRVACLAQGRLIRYLLTPPDGAVGGGPRAGDVFLGRVARVDRGLAAAFVDIGATRPGFLAFADASDPRRPPAEGEAVAVRVLRAAEGGKGAKLSGRAPPSSERLAPPATGRPPLRLQAAPEPIVAAIAAAIAAAASATPDAAGDAGTGKAAPGKNGDGSALGRVVVDDADALVMLRRTVPAIAPLLRHHHGGASVFAADAVDDQLAAAMAPWQALAGGGAFAVRETPAATTIDVDLGAAGGAAAVRATNLDAMAAIAEMIVLADLAGHIVIDPIAVRDRRQRGALLDRLRQTLAAAEDRLGDDRRIIRFGGFTPLGLIELIRERRGPSLRRQLGPGDSGESAPRAPWIAAGDALRALVAETAARPGRVPGLLVNEAVAAALAVEMAGARAAAEDRAGGQIAISVAAAPVIRPWKLVDPR